MPAEDQNLLFTPKKQKSHPQLSPTTEQKRQARIPLGRAALAAAAEEYLKKKPTHLKGFKQCLYQYWQPISTHTGLTPKKMVRTDEWEWIKKLLTAAIKQKEKRLVYLICPLLSDSELEEFIQSDVDRIINSLSPAMKYALATGKTKQEMQVILDSTREDDQELSEKKKDEFYLDQPSLLEMLLAYRYRSMKPKMVARMHALYQKCLKQQLPVIQSEALKKIKVYEENRQAEKRRNFKEVHNALAKIEKKNEGLFSKVAEWIKEIQDENVVCQKEIQSELTKIRMYTKQLRILKEASYIERKKGGSNSSKKNPMSATFYASPLKSEQDKTQRRLISAPRYRETNEEQGPIKDKAAAKQSLTANPMFLNIHWLMRNNHEKPPLDQVQKELSHFKKICEKGTDDFLTPFRSLLNELSNDLDKRSHHFFNLIHTITYDEKIQTINSIKQRLMKYRPDTFSKMRLLEYCKELLLSKPLRQRTNLRLFQPSKEIEKILDFMLTLKGQKKKTSAQETQNDYAALDYQIRNNANLSIFQQMTTTKAGGFLPIHQLKQTEKIVNQDRARRYKQQLADGVLNPEIMVFRRKFNRWYPENHSLLVDHYIGSIMAYDGALSDQCENIETYYTKLVTPQKQQPTNRRFSVRNSPGSLTFFSSPPLNGAAKTPFAKRIGSVLKHSIFNKIQEAISNQTRTLTKTT
jgi:hypothetical protein